MAALLTFFALLGHHAANSQDVGGGDREYQDRLAGMLIGGLLGDAAGGPVEFKSRDELRRWLPDLQSWSRERFQAELKSGELAKTFRLLPYQGIRPDVAPYGPWEADAPAGTVTDDSRHKVILMQCLSTYLHKSEKANKASSALTQKDLCRAYLDFADSDAIRERPDYVKLAVESFREYNSAAR